MNFIRYNKVTGVILGYGFMPNEIIQAEINEGKGILFASNINDIENWKVNIETKQLERAAVEAPIAIPTDAFSIPE